MRPTSGDPRWPRALFEFVALVNEGRYWDAHEALEPAWRRNKSRFYQGLIIYASAFVHAQRGNPRGVLRQLAKLRRYLGAYPDAYLGLDVVAILRHADAVGRQVAKAGTPSGQALQAALTWPALALDPRRLAGTEPELAVSE